MGSFPESSREADDTLKEKQPLIEPSSFVDTIFQALLELFLRLGQLLFYGLVEINAAFLTAVMTHPDVKQAMANIMVMGMNGFVTQPDLDEKFQIMTDTMAKNQEEAARNAGQEFPKLAGKFLEGMFSKKHQIDAAVEKEKNKRDKEKQISDASSSSEEIKTQENIDNTKDPHDKNSSSSLPADSASSNSDAPTEEKSIPPLARFFKPNPTPPTTPHRSKSPSTAQEGNAKSSEHQDPPIVRFFKQQSNKNKTEIELKETKNTTPPPPPAPSSSKSSPKPARAPLIQWPSPFQKPPDRDEPPLLKIDESIDHVSEASAVENEHPTTSRPAVPEGGSLQHEKSWDSSCFEDALADVGSDDENREVREGQTTLQNADTTSDGRNEKESDASMEIAVTEQIILESTKKSDESPKPRNPLLPAWPSPFQKPNNSPSMHNVPPLPSTESGDDGEEEGGIYMPTLEARTAQSLDMDNKPSDPP